MNRNFTCRVVLSLPITVRMGSSPSPGSLSRSPQYSPGHIPPLHHLIASAYSNNRLSCRFPGPRVWISQSRVCAGQRGRPMCFAAWKYDYIRLGNIFGSRGIIKIHFRMPFEDIEIGEIGYMLQQNYRYIYFIAYRLPVFVTSATESSSSI